VVNKQTNNPAAGILIASNGGSNDRKEKDARGKRKQAKQASKQERKKAAGVGKRGREGWAGEKRETEKQPIVLRAPTRA
jgi:hypothetical protein